MAQTTAQKAEIIEKFAQSKGDTGSPQVQVALLTVSTNSQSTSKLTRKTTTAVAVF